ncbi:uncharacterized protein [Nicotiana tomentosiformis]|uniref:uncharacterized protein n=1 Tax=Nicotiana tomentosiformis TaxID=4098 RepID=UPI00388CA1B1
MEKKDQDTKQGKEVNLETKEEEQGKENKAEAAGEGIKKNLEPHSHNQKGHNEGHNNKNENINNVNIEERTSDENRAEKQETVQSIKAKTTKKGKTRRQKKVSKKKSKVTFKHAKNSATTKNMGAIKIAMNEQLEENIHMTIQVNDSKRDDQIQHYDDGSSNVIENTSPNKTGEAVQESSNIDGTRKEKVTNW